MLFNSYEFIFVFLPIVFLGFFFIGRYSSHYAALWLAAASLFFYGWWNPKFVSLLLGSIVFNFAAGHLIGEEKFAARSKLIFITSIALNLILLGIFKYTNFFIASANTLGAHWSSLAACRTNDKETGHKQVLGLSFYVHFSSRPPHQGHYLSAGCGDAH